MIKNGTAPYTLLAAARRSGAALVRREDLRRLAPNVTHVDRAIGRLVAEGLAEKLDRGIWLIPSGKRPDFETPRFWSKPSLQDSRRISALVVANPRLRDIARTILAYGSATVEGALAELVELDAVPASVQETSARMIKSAKTGLLNAAHRRAAA